MRAVLTNAPAQPTGEDRNNTLLNGVRGWLQTDRIRALDAVYDALSAAKKSADKQVLTRSVTLYFWVAKALNQATGMVANEILEHARKNSLSLDAVKEGKDVEHMILELSGREMSQYLGIKSEGLGLGTLLPLTSLLGPSPAWVSQETDEELFSERDRVGFKRDRLYAF